MSLFSDWIKRGTRAAQPAAAASNKGMFYFVTDEKVAERSSGSAWESMTPASGWVLLETRSAAAGAAITFTTRNAPGQSGATFQDDFDEYVIVGGGIAPANNGADLLMQIGEGATPTWNTATSYQVACVGFSSAGVGVNDSGSGLTSNRLLKAVSNTATWYANFTITWFSLRVAAAVKTYTGNGIFFNSDPKFVQQAIGGHLVSSVVATAVKFFASSGNITGTIKIYGVSK